MLDVSNLDIPALFGTQNGINLGLILKQRLSKMFIARTVLR